MACYRPVDAWRLSNGEVVFKPQGAVGFKFAVPCGQCVGCRLERSRQWAVRCMHEMQMHDENCFVTLTYGDEHVPVDGGLCLRDLQLFFKRLRASFKSKKIRYFACGEYGEELKRPHYHAILFGIDFDDKVLHSRNLGNDVFISDRLASIWGKGFCTIGRANYQTAGYVARYCMKKVSGYLAKNNDGVPSIYSRVIPETGEIVPVLREFLVMSRRPGIGSGWFDKYKDDVYPADEVIVNGIRQRPPRFYDQIVRRRHIFYHNDLVNARKRKASKNFEDNTSERLLVKETVAKSKLSFFKRNL